MRFFYLPVGHWLLRTRPDGTREASWRMWLLIYLLPALFFVAAGMEASLSRLFLTIAEPARGEVVRVYEWEGWNPWNGSTADYSPVFRYRFSDGEMTDASTGMSSPNWNFPVGSHHDILFNPGGEKYVSPNMFQMYWIGLLSNAGGEHHHILLDPNGKGNVRLNNFESLWAVPFVIGCIGAAALIPSLLGSMLLRRWLRGGRHQS